MDEFELLHSGEHTIMDVRRYRPFILGIVSVWTLAELLILGAFYLVSHHYHGRGVEYLYLGLLAIAILIIVIGYAFVQTYIKNRLIITNSRVIVITQHGLMGQRIAQCSLEFIQDVSSDHQNLMAAILDYGNLSVETSGKEGTLSFTACPNPRKVTALIVRLCRERKQEGFGPPVVSLEPETSPADTPVNTPAIPSLPKPSVSLDAEFEIPKPPWDVAQS
ncbi:MAG TPA: PH domain-containing protein [Candidatus Polarisedimenticolaceae bacterium]|nr:PH domain-containing protein [Candidatus Polarisedimenticolaceae bacterium]